MSDKLVKDAPVEVSSDEDGFRGAWYSAILLDNPTKSTRIKLRVRYLTLLDNDASSSPLVEAVDQSHIRPVPPENLYAGVVLEEGLMVDADYKDGWWTGLLIKKIEESNKYLVYFDSPPDVIEFESRVLRPHFDWTGWKWVQPDIVEVDKSIFSVGTMVEVRSTTEKGEVSWFPSMMIKEIKVNGEKKFIVKDCNKHLKCNGDEARVNSIVDACRVRPTPPSFLCESYNLLEYVEAFRGGCGWRQGLVREIRSEKCYMVSIEDSKEESVYNHSDLRPLRVWEDGVWHDGPKQNAIKEKLSCIIKMKSMRSSPHAKPMTPKRVTKDVRRSLNPEKNDETFTKAYNVAATGELTKKRVAALMNDEINPITTPQVTSIASESISPETPSLTGTSLRQKVPETEGKKSREKTLEPMKNQKMLEKNSKDSTRKRKREENHNSCLKETEETCIGLEAEINGTSQDVCVDVDADVDRIISALIGNSSPVIYPEPSSDRSLNVVYDAPVASSTDVNETPAKDTLTVLPFVKMSPFWKKYETKEEYSILPQSPHFSPLVEAKEDFREISAIGLMVTFYELLEEVKDLQLDVSWSKLSSLSSSFVELEKHGFDVAVPQSRISKVVFLQDELAKKEEKRKCLEKKLEAEKSERHKFEEEMAEIEGKIQKLKRREEVAKEKKEEADKKIVELKSSAETIDREMEDVELEFNTTLSAPW